MISDISLGHSSANVERHCGSNILCSLGSEEDTSYLRSVSVYNGYFISHIADVCDSLAGVLYYLKLSFCGRFSLTGLKCISAKGDYDFFCHFILLKLSADGSNHNSLDGVHSVLSFVEYYRMSGKEYFVGDFADVISKFLLLCSHCGIEIVE